MNSQNKTPHNLAVEIIISHSKLANKLLKELAEKYQIDQEKDKSFWKLRGLSEMNLPKGDVNDQWTYWFHGCGCEFNNIITQQFLYVETSGKHYGVIDFFYLYKYMQTTPSLVQGNKEFQTFENFTKTLMEMERDKLLVDIGDYPEGSQYKDLVLIYLL